MADLSPRIGFIDKPSLKTNMAKITGWSPKGARLTDHVRFGHWNTQTFIAALHHDCLNPLWVRGRDGQQSETDLLAGCAAPP